MPRKGPDNDDRTSLLEGELTGRIIAAFYETYNVLGHGFLESVYKNALAIELRLRGLNVQVEVPVEVFYKGLMVGVFRFDHLVEARVAVEVKASAVLSPADKAQTLNYLTSTRIDVGLLLHYGTEPRVYRFVSPRIHAWCPGLEKPGRIGTDCTETAG